MNGIDISGWQPDVNLAVVPCDFVIIKATQGTSFVSKAWKKQIDAAIKNNKYVGLYHYASKGGARAEADHFLQVVSDYIGKAILVLDWEWDQNENIANPLYAVEWLEYVKYKTGITPFIYMSKSLCRQYSKQWDASYPLWCAQYADSNPTGYKEKPWTDSKGFGPWKGCEIHQYSSHGRLSGYKGNLDLDKAYISGIDWLMYATGDIFPEQPKEEAIEFPTLRKGDSSEYVRIAQTILKANGYDDLDVDGDFGPITRKTVKSWQKKHKDECGKADGIIGPLTWASLLKANV